MKQLKSVVTTIVGCIMLFGSLGALMQGLPLPAIFFLIGGLTCIAPIREVFERRFSLRMQRWHKYVLVIGCWCAAGVSLPHKENEEKPSSPTSVTVPSPQRLVGGIEHGLDSSKRDSHARPEKSTATKPAHEPNINLKPIEKAPSASIPQSEPTPKPQSESKPKTEPINNHAGCYFNGHELSVGPRGGCYYWSGSSKRYVDRSYCSGCR